MSLGWAESNFGLAHALEALAERRGDPAALTDAITCMTDAAEVYRAAGVSYWLPIAESSLAGMRAKLASMTADAVPGSSAGASG